MRYRNVLGAQRPPLPIAPRMHRMHTRIDVGRRTGSLVHHEVDRREQLHSVGGLKSIDELCNPSEAPLSLLIVGQEGRGLLQGAIYEGDLRIWPYIRGAA